VFLIASSKQFKFLFYLLYKKKLQHYLSWHFKKSGDNTFCAHSTEEVRGREWTGRSKRKRVVIEKKYKEKSGCREEVRGREWM
jgi:hypothetical protein